MPGSPAFNRYGQPNGGYNQPAAKTGKASLVSPEQRQAHQESPITTALQSSAPMQPNGQVNLNAPPPISGNYANGDFDVGNASKVYQNAARQYLGREMPEADIIGAIRAQGWKPGDKYVGQQGLNGILQNLYNSPEASALRAPKPAATSAAPATPDYGNFTPTPNAMVGWQQDKWANPNKHDAKYDAGRMMSSLGAPSAAGLQKTADYLRSLGHQVEYDGQSDTMTVDGIPVDSIIDFGGPNARWNWGAGYGQDPVQQALSTPASQGASSQGASLFGADSYSARLIQQILQGLQ